MKLFCFHSEVYALHHAAHHPSAIQSCLPSLPLQHYYVLICQSTAHLTLVNMASKCGWLFQWRFKGYTYPIRTGNTMFWELSKCMGWQFLKLILMLINFENQNPNQTGTPLDSTTLEWFLGVWLYCTQFTRVYCTCILIRTIMQPNSESSH